MSGEGDERRVERVVVPPELDGERADRALTKLFQSVSRGTIQRWIEEGRVLLSGQPVRSAQKLRAGLPLEVRPAPPPPSSALPEPMELSVLFEDAELLVIDKPAGLVVHPAAGHAAGTLVNGLLHRFGPAFAALAAPGGAFGEDEVDLDDEAPGPRAAAQALLRPGIVHRLDRGTSGVMVVAKTVRARDHLGRLFAAHDIERAYLAIAVGTLSGTHRYDTLHGRHPGDRKRFTTRVKSGRRAVTEVEALEQLRGATLVRATLSTGRTHQIRVHLTEAGHPLLGDPVYGSAPRTEPLASVGKALGRPALHAAVLGFTHPVSSALLRFEASLPEDFAQALRALR